MTYEEGIEKNPVLDRIWIGKNSAPNCSVYHSHKICSNDIEYIRKDFLLDRACEFITSNIWEYLTITHCGGEEGVKIDTDRFEKDFRKVMED